MKYAGLGMLMIVGFMTFTQVGRAHGLAITHPILSGQYLIEFEYEAPGQPVAGIAYLYSVRFLNNESKEPVSFATAQLKITNGSGTVHQSVMRASPYIPGVAEFILSLPQGGDYQAEVQIRDDKDQVLASGQTVFAAVAGTATPGSEPIEGLRGWGIVIIAIFVGMLIGMLLPRKTIK